MADKRSISGDVEYKVIGRHIRFLRKQKKMTQEEMAEIIDMSPTHFGKMERGDRPINLYRLAQICRLCQVPLETLVEGAVLLETDTVTAASDNTSFLNAMGIIAKGCSEEATRLMLRLCADIADEDKKNRQNRQ